MHALSTKSRLAVMAMALTFFSVGVTEFISVGCSPPSQPILKLVPRPLA